jgi:hypothetical protein
MGIRGRIERGEKRVNVASVEERSLRCVARRAATARKKRPGHSGRDDNLLLLLPLNKHHTKLGSLGADEGGRLRVVYCGIQAGL